MPLCTSWLHQRSGLPPAQPPEAFYRNRRGVLLPYCRHCRRVEMRLRKRQPSGPWAETLVQQIWRAYWTWQQRATPPHPAPPGTRWCRSPRPHYALETAFMHGYRLRWCLDCARIHRRILWHWARHRRRIPWSVAAQHYYRAQSRRDTWRHNRAALPGERWCRQCQAYYQVPAHWKHDRAVFCPAHTAAYMRQYYIQTRRPRQQQALQGASYALSHA